MHSVNTVGKSLPKFEKVLKKSVPNNEKVSQSVC